MHDLNTVRKNVISEIAYETIYGSIGTYQNCPLNSIRVVRVGDMLDSVGNFMSQDELNNKCQINCTLIDHLRIRQAIPGSYRHILELQI